MSRSLRVLLGVVFTVLGGSSLAARDVLPPVDQRFARDTEETPSFRRHIIPLVGRLGCNGRACHGSFQGQGGFQLSLFGYDFETDHQALLGNADEPRVNRADPAASLILRKPTRTIDHEGGKLIDVGGWQYRVLRDWIKGGAKPDGGDGLDLEAVEITPRQLFLSKSGQTVSLKVVAAWSDGVREDVTPLCRFRSNDDSVAAVDATGRVTNIGPGDTHIVVFYDNDVVTVPVLSPVSELVGDRYPRIEAPTRVDELVLDKWKTLGLVPSELCSDDEFLRRVSLDLAGTLPTPREVEMFLADTRANKRTIKIEELLASPAYVAWWSTKFCDAMGNHNRIGANNPFRTRENAYCRLWYQWMCARLKDNTPYDQIVERLVLANSRLPGQSYEEFCAEMGSYLRSKDPADIGQRPSVPFYWEVHNTNKSEENALQFAHAFLGLSIQCAQCHKHPFDQWRKQDFEQFTGFFGRVVRGYSDKAGVAAAQKMIEDLGLKKSNGSPDGQKHEELIRNGQVTPFYEVFSSRDGFAKGGSSKAFVNKPKNSGKVFSLRVLGGETLSDNADDPRVPLMNWLKSPHNPYFARSFVNRAWAAYFHAGLVDPPDDLNLANPPSNAAVLDYLADGFREHNYDMRWVHRQIAGSRTYQLSWKPNATNVRDERNVSRFIVRQMPAEVLYDAIEQATAVEPQGAAQDPADRAIAALPSSFGSGPGLGRNYALRLFGKPKRLLTCDCERGKDPSLLQSVFLQNDPEILSLIARKDGWAAQLDPATDRAKLIRECYLRTMSRPPTEAEIARCNRYLQAASDLKAGICELLLALINNREFLTVH